MRAFSSARIVLVLLCLLASATSVSAESRWILWAESGDVRTFHRTGAPHPQSSYTSIEDCVRAVDAQWQTWGAAEGPGHHGFHRLSATSSILMVTHGETTYLVTYTCLSDTIRPRGPDGSAWAGQGWQLMMPTSDPPGPINRWFQYGVFDSAPSCQAVFEETRRASRQNHEAALENHRRKQSTATEPEIKVARAWLKDSGDGLTTTENAICIATDDPRLHGLSP